MPDPFQQKHADRIRVERVLLDTFGLTRAQAKRGLTNFGGIVERDLRREALVPLAPKAEPRVHVESVTTTLPPIQPSTPVAAAVTVGNPMGTMAELTFLWNVNGAGTEVAVVARIL